MSTRLTKKAITLFESIKDTDKNCNEYWSSRKLAKVLEYADYRNFITVIGKAKEACQNSGIPIEDHFVDINEMVTIGSGAERPVDSVKLSRYACYLIVKMRIQARRLWHRAKLTLPFRPVLLRFSK